MKLYGYARVSSADQDLTIQRESLRAAGCDLIREEKVSGTTRQGRTELQLLLDFIREGDVLVVTRIDRLARSIKDLADIVDELGRKKAKLRCTEQPVDTTTPAGEAFLGMLGVFAQFETAIRRERQMEGIAKAKANGVYNKGVRRTVDESRIKELFEAGTRPTAIARELGISRQSVYVALKALGIEFNPVVPAKA